MAVIARDLGIEFVEIDGRQGFARQGIDDEDPAAAGVQPEFAVVPGHLSGGRGDGVGVIGKRRFPAWFPRSGVQVQRSEPPVSPIRPAEA